MERREKARRKKRNWMIAYIVREDRLRESHSDSLLCENSIIGR